MKRLFWALALLGAYPAQADLTLRGHSTVWALGMQGTGQETLWFDGERMRRDLNDRGRAYSQIYDLKRRELIMMDHAMRRAEVRPMTSLSRQVEQHARGELKYSDKDLHYELTPTGKRRALRKWSCAEHQLRVTTPALVGGERVEFEMAGTTWIAKGTPEQAETAAFSKALQTPDLFLDVPSLGRTQEQARALAEALRRITPKGVICAIDVELKYLGTGRVAELSKKLASRIALEIEGYDSQDIPAVTFDIPKDYAVQRR